ncbi:MAG: hypothetical protein CO127_11580 [Ignavibacteria bacterium CG_4_9_14_3_um_filter_36_18]|nr:MAG: hypothetical protein CO127_11580 [Ignavibacteria bacterium CG_4_9_14_3_um_filter_36_18]
MSINIKQIVFLSLIFFGSFLAQSKSCEICSRKIEGRFISAEGKYFHPQHFLCYNCGKPINSTYNYEDGNFFHESCFAEINNIKCIVCNEFIDGVYVKVDGKAYHRNCYEENVLPSCNYCGKPLTGRTIIKDKKKYHDYCYAGVVAAKCDICGEALLKNYLTDLYGNKFHASHENEYDKCDNCKRLICSNITNGGVKYDDGREICKLCYTKSYKGKFDTKSFLAGVLNDLKKIGFRLDKVEIYVHSVDRKKLKTAAGESYSLSMNGYCRSEIPFYIKNGKPSQKMKHDIYLLDRIPVINIEATLVHELMHVWLHENTTGKLQHDLREGSCNYLSYLYLQNKQTNGTGEVILQIENDLDKIYGDGFRKVKDKFYYKKISEFFDYLRSNINI